DHAVKSTFDRREFLSLSKRAGLGMAAGLTILSDSASVRAAPANEKAVLAAVGRGGRLDPQAVENEIRRRADRYLARNRLIVDYYRIGRQLVYPLPVESLSLPKIQVPTINVYPWATWMTWELEERVGSLGWAGEWFGDERARRATIADLAALARWPRYAQYRGPDLSSGHAGRLMWLAHSRWRWLGEGLRGQLEQACRRHADEILPGSNNRHGKYKTKADLLASENPHHLLHNISFIGTIGAALTAHVARHPSAKLLSQRVAMIFGAILESRKTGYAEGVGYDGYLLDFVADWLLIVDEDTRGPIVEHPRFADYLDESYMLAAPGTAEAVAELSDVEPREMPFHLSAQAKLARLQPSPIRSWHLSRCRPDWLRADALAAIHPLADKLSGKTPRAGALNAHYAVVLRSGWDAKDLAVAMACSSSPMSHIQCDNGSIVIGTHGRWAITDPGYQQYVQGAERDFTLGSTAHNAPVLNGECQIRKAPQRVSLKPVSDRVRRAAVELAACYPSKLLAKSVLRTLWCADTNLVVVADQISAADIKTISYHWHGCRDAAWWSKDGWVLAQLPESSVWLTSPQAEVDDSRIRRLDGSRGQLTLVTEADTQAPVVWWVFAFDVEPPTIAMRSGGMGIEVMSHSFSV
ncbi:MAG: heparinase II/III family protein, partial [Pirellulales bacterium]